jgi:hypothetical protein
MPDRRNRRPDALSSIFVETSQSKYAALRIGELMEQGWEEDYCLGLLLLGDNRAGKTRLVRHYVDTTLDECHQNKAVPPIVRVEVPPGCSLRSFPTAVLRALKDPDPSYGNLSDRTGRIAEAAERHNVQLLVFDEVQRLIDADTEKVKENVAIWVSGLLNHRVCPVLLVGEPKAKWVFVGNKHLEGRTMGQVDITSFDWADEKQRYEFASVLHQIDTQLGMAELSDLGRLRTAQRIHEFAEGLLGQAARLIGHARVIARRLNRPKLTYDIFEQAVNELRVGEGRGLPNPFRSDQAG